MRMFLAIIRDAIGFCLFVGMPVALVLIVYNWSKLNV